MNDAANTDEDTPVTLAVLANDADVDGDALVVSAVGSAAHGAVTTDGATVTYTPNLGFAGSDSFAYTVSDPSGATASAQVNVTVQAVNTPPAAANDAAVTDEDTPVTVAVLANDTDGDGDALTVTAAGPASNGSTATDGVTVSYTPNANFHGVDTFTYGISDGQGGAASAQVVVTVNPVNDPPTALNDAANTDEDTPVTLAVLANDADVDGDALVVSAVGSAAHGAVTTDGATVTYTPNLGFAGSDSFAYTVSDPSGATASAQVNVTVQAVNTPPAAANDAAVTDEDTPVTVAVLANDTDGDGDALTVTAAGPASNGSTATDGVTVSYTPNANFHGVDTFTYGISDGQGGAASAQVVVTVNPVNDPPTALNDAANTDEDTPVTVAVLANDADVDGDALVVSSVGSAAHGTVTTDGATVTYTPNPGFAGSDSFAYTVSDPSGATASAQVAVTVQATIVHAGYALQFDGVNDFVKLTYTSSMMASGWKSTKTVSLWIKPTGPSTACAYSSVPGCDFIFGDKPQWWGITRGIINGADRIWIWNWDGNEDRIGIPYVPGEWVHVTLVHSGGVLRAFKNGVEVGSKASGPTVQPTTGALPWLQLGGMIHSASNNFAAEGLIDEVQIWNVARTASQIQQDMNHVLVGNEPGLAAYYRMSDGYGTIVTDDSIYNWNGTLYDGCCGVAPNGSLPQWVASSAF